MIVIKENSSGVRGRGWNELRDWDWHTFSSVQFSHSVVSDSSQPHESQHARPPCPSPTPGLHSDSRPSSQWCYPAISSSVVPFSSCPQSLSASESFPMSQVFAWGGQSTGFSASASVFAVNIHSWFPLGLTGLMITGQFLILSDFLMFRFMWYIFVIYVWCIYEVLLQMWCWVCPLYPLEWYVILVY